MTIKELKEEMKTWSVSKLSKNCSFVLTIFLWFVLLIVFIFVNPVIKEPKYKEIQIVLEPIKKVEKKEKVSSAKQQATSKKTEETKTVTEQKVPPKQEVKKDIQKEVSKSSKTENTVAKKTETKPKPAAKPVEKKAEITPKTTPTPAKTLPKSEPVKYAKSVDDLMEEQFSEKKNVNDFDWDSMFDESEDSETSNLSTTKKVTTKNTVQGTAGTVSDKNSEPIVSSKLNGEKSAKVSDNTSGKLSDISNKKYSGKSNVSDAATVQVATGSNEKGTVKMQNGMSRMLLYPAEPNIIISDENARLIENTVTVKITFTVLESGNVPSAEISITPASLLPSAVRNEIVSQLSKWRFELADYVASATLELTIVKK
jgi:outer membrane biosynthesis protein TonB